MKEGQTDFLDLMVEPDVPATASPAPEPTTSSTPEPAEPQGQPRTPDGKFAEKPKAEAEQVQQGVKPEAQPAPAAEPPAADDTSPHVPRAALEAERKKRQALEAELAKLKPAASATPQSPSPKGPEFTPPEVDFEQDPQAYVQSHIHSLKMTQSKFFAVQQSSEAEVEEAWAAFDEACKNDPAVSAWSFSPALQNNPHPYGEVLKWHRKQKQLAQIEAAGGIDAFIAAKVAEAQAAAGAQPAPAVTPIAQARPAPPKPVTPPSLANGGAGAVDAPEMPNEDQVFESMFGGPKTKTRNR